MADDSLKLAPAGYGRKAETSAGLARLGLIAIAVLMVYLMALGYAHEVDGDYGRVWTWQGYLVSVAALVVIGRHWKRLNWLIIGVGVGLGALVGLIGFTGLSQGSTFWLTEVAFTALAFIGGALLRQTAQGSQSFRGVRVTLLDGSVLRDKLRPLARSLGFGALVGLLFAVLNAAYFALTGAPGQGWQPVLPQAVAALRPAVFEEIVFRFFVMNLFVAAVGDRLSPRTLMIGTLALGTLPHAFFHGAGGLVANPLGYIGFSLLLSLVFGLPMAYLQFRRDLATAIGFHWVIDFVRFWAGY